MRSYPFGNYPNYYSIHATAEAHLIDPRLSIVGEYFPAADGLWALFRGKRVLDIGCNNGTVTTQIGQFFAPASVLGVDVDRRLIRKSWAHLRYVYSRAEPAPDPAAEPKPKRMRREPQTLYFPASALAKYGQRELPDTPTHAFPGNVGFQAAEFVYEFAVDKDAEDSKYDIVVCLSLTKWIHLNYGDAGMLAFFDKLAAIVPVGGYLLLEHQYFKSYDNAVKANPQFAERRAGLTLDPESDFSRLLNERGFHALPLASRHDEAQLQRKQRALVLYCREERAE